MSGVPVQADLIYDLGSNDGKDTSFYLAKGFRVVAVDADPTLCDKIRGDHAAAIASGRLSVENIGIGGESKVMPFYVNQFAEWSSFKANSKATKALTHTVIEVRMEPLSKLIAAHGVPYYLKIDIEGHEMAALASMDPDVGLPAYLSFELNQDRENIMNLLASWGFSAFQLIRQGRDFLAAPPNPAREGGYVAQKFTNGHSGCFGRDLPDHWLDKTAATAAITDAVAASNARTRLGEPAGWFDLHARRSAAL